MVVAASVKPYVLGHQTSSFSCVAPEWPDQLGLTRAISVGLCGLGPRLSPANHG